MNIFRNIQKKLIEILHSTTYNIQAKQTINTMFLKMRSLLYIQIFYLKMVAVHFFWYFIVGAEIGN